jgi:hypothetical protein
MHLLIATVAAFTPGCIGVQAGALYDYEHRRTEAVFGIFVEGFGDPMDVDHKNGKPTYGARTGLVAAKHSRTNFSIQPEGNIPLGKTVWNTTLAAGPAMRPWSLHSTACVRELSIINFGICSHWLTEGKAGAAVDLSSLLPTLVPVLLLSGPPRIW